MAAPGFFDQTWQIARKEIKEHSRSRRFLLFLLLFGGANLIATVLMSSGVLGLNYPPSDMLAIDYLIASTFIWIIPIAFAYDAISRERANRSLDIVLSKPVTRIELVLGKFLGALLILVIIIGSVHLAGFVISIGFSGSVPNPSMFGAFGSYLGVIFLGMICYLSLAILFSVIARSSSTSLIVTIILSMFVLSIPAMISMIYWMMNVGEELSSATAPWWLKVAYAVNPGNCMAIVYEMLPPSWVIDSLTSSGPMVLNIWQSIFAMFIFVAVCLSLSLAIFQHKDLQ